MSPALQNVKATLHKTAHVSEQQKQIHTLKQKTVNSMLFLTCIVFGVLYLIQINFLATRGYVMKDLEKQIAVVQKENNALNMKILEEQGLGSLQGKIDALGLVQEGRIEYIASQEAGLAAR